MHSCPESDLNDPMQVQRVYRQLINYNTVFSRFNTTDFYPSLKLLGHVTVVNITVLNLDVSVRKYYKAFCMDEGRCPQPM